jgi:hypothetical protein
MIKKNLQPFLLCSISKEKRSEKKISFAIKTPTFLDKKALRIFLPVLNLRLTKPEG